MRLVLYAMCGCAAIGLGLGLGLRAARGKPAPQLTPKSVKSARNECHEQGCVDQRADARKQRLAIEAVRLPVKEVETLEYALYFAKHSTSDEQIMNQIRSEEFKRYIPQKLSQCVLSSGIQSSAILNTAKFGMSDMPWHPEDRELLAFVNTQDARRECVQHVIVGRQSLAQPENTQRRSTKRRKSARGMPPTPPENFDDMGDASSCDDLLRKNAQNIKNRFVYAMAQPVVEAAVAPPRECPDPRPAARDIGPIPPVTPTSAPQPPRKKKSEEEQRRRQELPTLGGAVAPTAAAKKLTVELAIEQLPANTPAQLPANDDRIKQESMFFDRRVAVAGVALSVATANAMVGDNDIALKNSIFSSPPLTATHVPSSPLTSSVSSVETERRIDLDYLPGGVTCLVTQAQDAGIVRAIASDHEFSEKIDKLRPCTYYGLDKSYCFARGMYLETRQDGVKYKVFALSYAKGVLGHADGMQVSKISQSKNEREKIAGMLETMYEDKSALAGHELSAPSKIGHELAGPDLHTQAMEDPKNQLGRRR